MNLTFAPLMARASDEPDAVYLLAAEELTVSPDGLVFRFRLRPGIVFHDGSEITASDVAFSLTTLKSKWTSDLLVRASRSRRRHRRRQAGRSIASSDARGSGTYRRARGGDADFFREVLFDPAIRRDLAGSAAGSGPYRVARFEQGAVTSSSSA